MVLTFDTGVNQSKKRNRRNWCVCISFSFSEMHGKEYPMTREEKYMKEAIRQAKKAGAIGEVPIGCVIVYGDEIVGRGYNRRITDKNTLSHAELNAIKKASKRMGDWRLDDCEMYVTLEPCQMCSGAIVQSRIKKVYIGCMNPKAGCAGSILNLLQVPQFNHQVEMEQGIMEEECSQMLKAFFRELRRKKKEDEGKKEDEAGGTD